MDETVKYTLIGGMILVGAVIVLALNIPVILRLIGRTTRGVKVGSSDKKTHDRLVAQHAKIEKEIAAIRSRRIGKSGRARLTELDSERAELERVISTHDRMVTDNLRNGVK